MAAPSLIQQWGQLFHDLGKLAVKKQALRELEEQINLKGTDYLLDVVLDLEEARMVWPLHVWWALGNRSWAVRTGQPRPRSAAQAWSLTMTGRAEVSRRKMERKTGLVTAAAAEEARATADAVTIERPDAEWNF